ncbi:hypothetical protein Hanom_Chr17g01553651 [Helianthus anomalus]
MDTLTISHRPLLRLPVTPTSAPAPLSLSSTTPPPGHRSVAEYLTDKSARLTIKAVLDSASIGQYFGLMKSDARNPTLSTSFRVPMRQKPN